VPHVHVHILPRSRTDFDGVNDRVYPALEDSEAKLQGDLAAAQGKSGDETSARSDEQRRVETRFVTPKEEDRRPRSLQEMEDEATWLAGLFVSPEQ
jgi:bis(5'-adenosyl)-triphosphatase